MKHANISIFVPHLGCPNKCSFCNQCHITGKEIQPSEKDVDFAVSQALMSKNYSKDNTEIAFFGGSFTAIDKEYMITLLSAAYKYVANKTVKGIRISTRPDCINDDVLKILKSYGVTAIELGAQSMVDKVLLLNDRGHTSSDVKRASNLIKAYGFELGLQMMTGLYGDNDEGSIYTAIQLVNLRPDTVRIYPTIVLKNTRLAELYFNGLYKPQTIDQAATICLKLIDIFEKNNINVIRLGLHTIDKDSFIAGPWHSAFGEICESARYFSIIEKALNKQGAYKVFVKDTEISKAIGQSKSNINKFKNLGFDIKFIGDKSLSNYEIKVREVE